MGGDTRPPTAGQTQVLLIKIQRLPTTTTFNRLIFGGHKQTNIGRNEK